MANKISLALRDGDIVSRYGGEEFLVVLTGTTASEASAVAERIRKSVESFRLNTSGDAPARQVTISIGLALWEGDETPEMLIKRADEALYDAKRSGKNQTVVAPPPQDNGTHTERVHVSTARDVA